MAKENLLCGRLSFLWTVIVSQMEPIRERILLLFLRAALKTITGSIQGFQEFALCDRSVGQNPAGSLQMTRSDDDGTVDMVSDLTVDVGFTHAAVHAVDFENVLIQSNDPP